MIESDVANGVVYGVLFAIVQTEKAQLDQAEGLGAGYDEKPISVVCKGELRKAIIYSATRTDPSLRPYTWYRALVLAGATEHRLPEQYIARIAATEAVEDPDLLRHERNMQLVEASR